MGCCRRHPWLCHMRNTAGLGAFARLSFVYQYCKHSITQLQTLPVIPSKEVAAICSTKVLPVIFCGAAPVREHACNIETGSTKTDRYMSTSRPARKMIQEMLARQFSRRKMLELQFCGSFCFYCVRTDFAQQPALSSSLMAITQA
eukprot:2922743-Amphidinium_carterae.1